MIIIASKQEKELLQSLRSLEKWDKADTVPALSAEVISLKKKIVELEISKSKKQEDFDKQERELRHMIGLEKKRQEFEIAQAKKETEISVREGNLKAEQKRFEENLAFNNQRYEKTEQTMSTLLGQILERLPNVNMDIKKKGK